ncbi:MAG: hypothetical protein A2X93_09170 [Deltaproteobacteria bacterium GWC2_56_8]|nr:MAG: hypothetical protein A2X99_10185 [Deltaproteobacteria bacterium GWB2_55_19]OGP35442.1 MAG: hypothetical protein A2X93_09170 [Deltaproteobacteria bacterium GWC2_56_8]HAO93426.1 hypothetical protein [Deltaproteobacteria bacterium]
MGLTERYLKELKENVNVPNVVLELNLDSGVRKFGFHTGGFFDIVPCLKTVSSFQSKLDTRKGYTTRGEITAVITGRENFREFIKGEYVKNRRVTRKDGFVSEGFCYADYAATYTGIVSDWSRKGDELTITISDDLIDATIKIPEETEENTQYISYLGANPADIMTDILVNRLGVAPECVDTGKFATERDLWLNGWKFSRVITEPEAANEYLNELQAETNSFIIHDGERISLKVYAPPLPGETVEEWTDKEILEKSFSQKSGYRDNFYNRVVVYYDYDESGSDGTENFESAVIALDAASEDESQWDEASTKTVKARWIRSYTFSQASTITGVVVFHASKSNGEGSGALVYIKADNTLQWTPQGGTAGSAVEVAQSGRYDISDADGSKYLRVIVDAGALPAADATDYITVEPLNGPVLASSVANKLLNFYRDPSSTVSFEVDINNGTTSGRFLRPTDLLDITTDEASDKGVSSWQRERVMITSVRPDITAGKTAIEAMRAKMMRNYGFVAPPDTPDYGAASKETRAYGFAARSHIW